MDEIAQSMILRDENSLKSAFPLLQYATTSWVAHTKQSEQMGVSQDDILHHFNWPSEATVQVWVRVYRIISRHTDDCPPEGTKLIHIVSRYGLLGPLQVILQSTHQAGADIDSKNGDNRTPLWWAAEKGYETIVKLLLDQGADAESKDYHRHAPLWRAVVNEDEAIVKLLLDEGADVDARADFCHTSLSWAARKGHEAIVKLLFDKGTDVDSADDNGRTPLRWATEYRHEAIVKLLQPNLLS